MFRAEWEKERLFIANVVTRCVVFLSERQPSVFQSNDNQFLWELIGGPPKTRNMSACWQDGRFFAENETWVVDSCTKCTCKVRPRQPCSLQPVTVPQPPWSFQHVAVAARPSSPWLTFRNVGRPQCWSLTALYRQKPTPREAR